MLKFDDIIMNHIEEVSGNGKNFYKLKAPINNCRHALEETKDGAFSGKIHLGDFVKGDFVVKYAINISKDGFIYEELDY